MSGSPKTFRAKLSDGTVVEVRNSAGWDVYSWVKNKDGKWYEGLRGSSFNSVRSRTITWARGREFEVIHMSEIMPEPIEQYFANHPVIQGQRFAIVEAWVDGLGWVKEMPDGFKVTGRPTRSFCRLLATRYGVTALAVGNPVLWADFPVSQLGLRLPKRSAA